MRAPAMLLAVMVAMTVFAAEPDRYVVVLKSRGISSAAVMATGATLEHDLGDRIVVAAPAQAIDKLREHPDVRYVQRVVAQNDESVGMPARSAAVTVDPTAGMTWTSGDYSYDGAGNISAIGTQAAPGTQGYRTYGYDSVSRLTKAVVGVGTGATHEYGYDVYGNMTSRKLNGQPTTIPVASGTNRLTDATYDEVGNQTSRGSTAATYDGFGMIMSYQFDGLNSETMVYTASDERIGVLRGTQWTWSLRDRGGKVLRQFRSSSTSPTAPWEWVEDFVYRDGLLLGSERVPEEGGRRRYHLDHLGSVRLVTGATGSLISEHDFLPFGEERTAIKQHQDDGYDREEPMRFTGHERDFDRNAPSNTSSYIDYMHARAYVPEAPRFLSPDPLLGNLLQPQSWNRYAYVLNNPVNLLDPTGLQAAGNTGMTITVEGDSPETEQRKRKRREEARRRFELEMKLLRLRAELIAVGTPTDPTLHSAIRIRDSGNRGDLGFVYSFGGQAHGRMTLTEFLSHYGGRYPVKAYPLSLTPAQIGRLRSVLDKRWGRFGVRVGYDPIFNNCAQDSCSAIREAAPMSVWTESMLLGEGVTSSITTTQGLIQYLYSAGYMGLPYDLK